jgi:hypothetical protein
VRAWAAQGGGDCNLPGAHTTGLADMGIFTSSRSVVIGSIFPTLAKPSSGVWIGYNSIEFDV